MNKTKAGLMKTFCTVWLMLLLGLSAFAQTKTRSYNDDIGFTVAVNVPLYDWIENDTAMGLTYGHFYHNGLGFRTGLQYIQSISDVDSSFGIPLAFAYRTGSRSGRERLSSGVNSAAKYAYWNAYDYGTVDVGDLISSFFINLLNNFEFTAGITPGYIAGGSSSARMTSYSDGRYEKYWTERNGRFSLSLDAGACMNYSIWRFDVKLMPAFHYLLTDNYIYRKSLGNDIVTETIDSSQPIKWFFTLSGGLSFRF